MLKKYNLYSISKQNNTETINLKSVTAIEIKKYLFFRDEKTKENMIQYLKREGKCYISFDDNNDATGHYLVMFNNDKNNYIDLKKREAYIHYCFVDPKQRNKKIYQKALVNICYELFHSNNINRIYIVVDKSNLPSLKAIEKVGFVKEKVLREKWSSFFYRNYKLLNSFLKGNKC